MTSVPWALGNSNLESSIRLNRITLHSSRIFRVDADDWRQVFAINNLTEWESFFILPLAVEEWTTYSMFGSVRRKTFSCIENFEDFDNRKVTLRGSLKESLEDNCWDSNWSLLRSVWRSVWRRIGDFCGDFWRFSDDFWGDCDCQQDKLLVELDDCYCCACWRNLLFIPAFTSVSWFGLLSVLFRTLDNIRLCRLAIKFLKTLMETRSKAQRDAELADAKGSGFITGEGETHPTCDPSPPILTPVGARATPVLMEESSSDAEQSQEHSDLRHRSEISTYATNKPRTRPVKHSSTSYHKFIIMYHTAKTTSKLELLIGRH